MPANIDHDLIISLIESVKNLDRQTSDSIDRYEQGHRDVCDRLEKVEKDLIRGEGRFTAIETKQKGFCESLAEIQQMVSCKQAEEKTNEREKKEETKEKREFDLQKIGMWLSILALAVTLVLTIIYRL